MPAIAGLRVLWDHLGRRLQLRGSSEVDDHAAAYLEMGDLSRYWLAVSTAAQWLGYDAGSGFTTSPNTLVIPGADYLVANGFTVDLKHSTDGTETGTSIGALLNGPPFPWAPITAAHLIGPHAKHAIAEWNAIPQRGWYLHLSGTVVVPARLAGGWFLGTATTLPSSPAMPGRVLGADRTYRGADIETSWPITTTANAKQLADLIAVLTDDMAAGLVETVAGVMFGGTPAWLYDVTGRTFNGTTGVHALLPVICTTPLQAFSTAVAPNLDAAPVSIRWRVRR